jgi:hypothetical protein
LFTQRGHFVCAECIGLIMRKVIERPFIQAPEGANGVYPL